MKKQAFWGRGIILIKRKWYVFVLILGCLLTLISLTIAYSNHFSGSQGMLFLLIGVPLLIVGIVFTPKIRKIVGFIIELFTRSI
jgi:hypothetical protein